MNILITGADGQLGSELQPVLGQHDVVPAIWPQFDLLTPGVEEFITGARPDVIVHAAAYTDVDRAEAEPALAWAVNAEGTARVAKAAASVGARLIYISTDYVFNGTKRSPYLETDTPAPINMYGRSKLEGERQAVSLCPSAVVVRTSWLYGLHGKNFVSTIMRLARAQPELRVVNDQHGSPTYAYDFAVGLKELIECPTWSFDSRTLHLAGTGHCSWHEFATAIVTAIGSATPVRPIPTSEFKRAAQRPANSVLANTILSGRGITLPPWREGLGRYLTQVKNSPDACRVGR